MIRKHHKLITASAFVTFGLAGLLFGVNAKAEGEACTAKTFKSAKVKEACARGGRDAAKAYMKKILKKGKEDGSLKSCKDCHTSLKTFELTPDGADKLKRLEG